MKKKSFNALFNKKNIKRALMIGLLAFPVAYNVPLGYATNHLSVFQQTYVLNLKFNNEELGSAIDKISEQAGVRILYSNEQIQTKKRISATIQTSDIREALKAVLGSGYEFRQIDNYISIAKGKGEGKEKQSVPSGPASSQQGKTVKGKVMGVDNEPLPGVTIVIVGSTRGVTTDLDGTFSIDNRVNVN